MAWSDQAMSESFLLSNMAPQIGIGFNRGIWSALEWRVRKWTEVRDELYVVTGPIYLPQELETIGPNNVAVPSHFFKVIFDPIRVEGIAFVLPNEYNLTRFLDSFIVSIGTVEDLTGLDFLRKLADPVEQLVEEHEQAQQWPR